MKSLSQSRRSMSTVLPKKAKWIKDAAAKFNPDANEVITKQGHIISYDFLIIAVGLQLCYGKVTQMCRIEYTKFGCKLNRILIINRFLV